MTGFVLAAYPVSEITKIQEARQLMGFNLKQLLNYSTEILAVVPHLAPAMLQKPAIRNPIAISFGAIAGALSRYYLSLWFAQRFGNSFPYGIFFINLTGCLGMGFFVTLIAERSINIPPEVRLLVTVGFLGAYTTFSTYGMDTVTLLRNRSLMAAGFYWAGSAVLGIVCIQLGIVLARLLR